MKKYWIIPVLLLFFCMSIPAYADTIDADENLKMDIALLQQRVTSINKNTQEILRVLKGDGPNQDGICTKVAVHGINIDNLYNWMMGISISILGLFGWSIKSALKRA